MSRILMVIAPEQFRDEELHAPAMAFKEKGWGVDVASTRVGEVAGMLGAIEHVELELADVKDTTYDAVVVVGGMGSPEHLWHNDLLHQILKTHVQKQRVVSAICLSGAVLAKAGVLQGKKATVYETPDSMAALEQGGATYTAQPVTVDGLVVTANGPEAAEDFAKSIIQAVNALQPVA